MPSVYDTWKTSDPADSDAAQQAEILIDSVKTKARSALEEIYVDYCKDGVLQKHEIFSLINDVNEEFV